MPKKRTCRFSMDPKYREGVNFQAKKRSKVKQKHKKLRCTNYLECQKKGGALFVYATGKCFCGTHAFCVSKLVQQWTIEGYT